MIVGGRVSTHLEGMRPPSRQLLSVEETFGVNGWHCELVEGREVLRSGFEGHHTRIDLIAQVHPQLNALTVVTETPMPLTGPSRPSVFEMLMYANKPLTLGSFEYDIERKMLVFRITNLFERERYDADIIASMVHCAIAELDRLVPYVATICQTAPDLLADLDLERLLEREDLLPTVPEGELEEEEY